MVSKRFKTFNFRPLILLNVTLLILVSSSKSDVVSHHHTDFVYMKCLSKTHLPGGLVLALLKELVNESSKSRHYHTSTGDDRFAVSGVFQCRGDLTNGDCHDCVLNSLPRVLSCESAFPARVQLKGCYMSLELEPEPDPDQPAGLKGARINHRVLIKDNYLQHKKCGERRAWSEGLAEARDAAFDEVARCTVTSGDGHCKARHEGMYAMGQCEGSLGACECGECITNAFQVARDECWGSYSGEVYLEKCFVSFKHHSGGGSGKLVAVVVGVGIASALLFAFCYCIRSSRRKDDDW